MQGPECGREEGVNVVGEFFVADGEGEDGDATVAIWAGAGTERGKGMIGFAGVAEKRTEKLAVTLEDVELGVKGNAEAGFEVRSRGF